MIAVADAGRKEAWVWKTIPYDLPRLVKAIGLLAGPGGAIVCYEAGPTGYELQRTLVAAGYECQVVAPSLIPTKSGSRVKTDRRDAAKLAHFLRSGDLTPITIPSEEREALRDLERSRDDAERVARQQLSKLLLRHGLRSEQTPWTKKHLDWVRALRIDNASLQAVKEGYAKTVEDATERVERLTTTLQQHILASSLAPLVEGLQVLRGVALVTAATIAAEIGGFERFRSAKPFMAYVGLTPSEESSGERVRRGAITKCGNGHVRRLLVESAQHYRRPPAMSVALRRRSADQPDRIKQIGWEAQKRLHHRLRTLSARGKAGNKAIVAVARELAGFVWAIGKEIEKGSPAVRV